MEDPRCRVGATESLTGSVGVGAPWAGRAPGPQIWAGAFGREIRGVGLESVGGGARGNPPA